MFLSSKNFKISLLSLSFLVPALLPAVSGDRSNERSNKNVNVTSTVNTYINNGSCTKSTWFATACALAAATKALSGNSWITATVPALGMAILYGWEWAIHGVNDTHKKNLAVIAAGLATGYSAGWAARYGVTRGLQYAHIINSEASEPSLVVDSGTSLVVDSEASLVVTGE